MRIAYGVHGYGRGHAMRVLALLPKLAERNEVRVFAGGNAFEILAKHYPVEHIPHLTFDYRGSRLSRLATLASNADILWDLFTRGRQTRQLEKRLAEFDPEVVVSDSEPLLLRAAARIRVPTIGLDHVGVIAHCRPLAPHGDWLPLAVDAAIYRLLLGRVDRAVVSSFYNAPIRRPGVRIVRPILRERVLRAKPSLGRHLLVYFNNGAHLFAPHVEASIKLLGCPAVVYGAGREGQDGEILYKPIDEERFIDDLAGCSAVLSTAGHQLICEATFLGKPILVSPESSAEQRLNAFQVELLGVGRSIRHSRISAEAIRDFLGRAKGYRAALARLPWEESPPPHRVLESLARELTAGQTAHRLRSAHR